METVSMRREPAVPTCIILDFDGTLTDVEHHAPRYEAAFREELAERSGSPRATVERAWIEAASEIAGDPELGWIYEERVVAPAGADPYLFANAVARRILPVLGRAFDEEAAALLYASYRAAYSRIETRFRPEVPAVLDALAARDFRVFVVTNANADDVAAKLDTLRLTKRAALAVRGDARKFRIVGASEADARFDSLPDEMRISSLARPLFLKRGHYFDILNRIWNDTRSSPETTLVCGDVFELDLALPAAIGAHVQLCMHARTRPHERSAALALSRGGAGTGLEPLLTRLDGLTRYSK
jgi:phosphoglycolate phosphatase-like HAD superfamily hydrolase